MLPNVETVTALDIEPFLDGFNLPFWQRAGVENKIQRKYGDARESLRALAEQKQAFDMIFIDADKPSYRAYVEMALELDLLADDGTILAVSNACACQPSKEAGPLSPHPRPRGLEQLSV